MERIGGIRLEASIADIDGAVTARDLQKLARRPGLKVLQCSGPVSDAVWALVNEHVSTTRPDVRIRVYAHYSSPCNLSFARLLPNVRHFAADCLMQASGIEAIATLPRLESLSLDVFDLEDFGVLERIHPGLTWLSLGATRSRKPRLAPLRRFRELRTLRLDGQKNGIEVLSELSALEELTLRSITMPNLSYLTCLPRLRSLALKLGGIRDLKQIERKKSIEYLEFSLVRELSDIDVVGTLPCLRDLRLRSLRHVESLPPLRNANALRRIIVENLKGLRDLKAAEFAPALEEFALIDGRNQTPNQLLPVLRNPNVKRVRAGLGSERRNAEFLRLCREYGKAELNSWTPFN